MPEQRARHAGRPSIRPHQVRDILASACLAVLLVILVAIAVPAVELAVKML